jgi:hypothetical protein
MMKPNLREPWIETVGGLPSFEQALEFSYCSWCLNHAELLGTLIPKDPLGRTLDYHAENDHGRILTGLPDGFLNWVAWSDIQPDLMKSRISEISREISDWLGPVRRPCEWSVLGTQPHRDKLIYELEEQGWRYFWSVPGMTCDLSGGYQFELSGEFELRSVRSESQSRDWLKPFMDGFDISIEGEGHFERLFSRICINDDYPFRNYTLYRQGAPISSGSLCFRYGVAVIFNIATIFGARCQGAGTQMVRALKKEASRLGYQNISLFAQAEAQSIYLREGFKPNSCWWGVYRRELGGEGG